MTAGFWFMFAAASFAVVWGLMQTRKRQEVEGDYDRLFYWIADNVINELEPEFREGES